MATMILDEATGGRTFVVPLAGEWPGAPFEGPAELVLTTVAPGDRPEALAVRFRPAPAAFLLRLNRLVQDEGFPGDPADLALAAAGRLPEVTYAADAATVAGLPAGIDGLDALERALAGRPLPAFARFAPAAIAFRGRM